MPPLNNIVQVETAGEFDLMLYRQAQQNEVDLKDHDQRLRRELWLTGYQHTMTTSNQRDRAESEANRAVAAFDKAFESK